MTIEALLSLAVLAGALALLPITENAHRPAYGKLYEYQVLEDVMEIAAKKPELLRGAGLEEVANGLGACVLLNGTASPEGCGCAGKETVSTTRIIPSGEAFERITAALCMG
jgi:hypothetical protein